jgi:hypothetical protein
MLLTVALTRRPAIAVMEILNQPELANRATDNR